AGVTGAPMTHEEVSKLVCYLVRSERIATLALDDLRPEYLARSEEMFFFVIWTALLILLRRDGKLPSEEALRMEALMVLAQQADKKKRSLANSEWMKRVAERLMTVIEVFFALSPSEMTDAHGESLLERFLAERGSLEATRT